MSPTSSPPLDPASYADRSGVPIAVVAVTLSVATACVCLRTYARAVMLRQFGLDDWAAVIAVLFAIGSGVSIAASTLYGAGRHMAVVDPSQLWKYFRAFYVSIVLYNASLTATKLTFLLQYHRILGTGTMRKAIAIAFVVVALWSVSQLLVTIFNCTPIHKFWDPETPGTCIPSLPFWYFNAAGNITTDVIIFVLPLPALCRLNLRKGQKLGLIGVFCLGFFTCAISVIRIQYLKLSDDVTWDNVAASCWSIGEVCSGITCACLPTLRPFIICLLPGMMSSRGGLSDDNKYYYRPSSGRDIISDGSRLNKSTTEHGGSSCRGVVYPEDLELQSDDRSDKEMRVATVERLPLERPGQSHPRYGYRRPMDKVGLGLRPPTVQTEVRVESSPLGTAWPAGIEFKRDVEIMASGQRSG
ncbi:hypothetical protein C8A01DRAFT_14814 [Parachaetomium inaequale]|uniref:Rhodopsin domain-containing protein n=1 Tax=Parachaetomium inaequale TaxID=2588326 RepID=A0AAN6PI84_9PEZI|nr:hypothetical protein C8A01DRAFT_14814 [Parachaetomium inaequale]